MREPLIIRIIIGAIIYPIMAVVTVKDWIDARLDRWAEKRVLGI